MTTRLSRDSKMPGKMECIQCSPTLTTPHGDLPNINTPDGTTTSTTVRPISVFPNTHSPEKLRTITSSSSKESQNGSCPMADSPHWETSPSSMPTTDSSSIMIQVITSSRKNSKKGMSELNTVSNYQKSTNKLNKPHLRMLEPGLKNKDLTTIYTRSCQANPMSPWSTLVLLSKMVISKP